MPRRTIVIGAQQPQFQFQDDFGPLNNGLAYAAGQWLASGRDRAQIEMQRDAQKAQDDQHREELDQTNNFRNQDLDLRRLALGQQDQARTDSLEERKQAHADRVKHEADTLLETNRKNTADAGAKFRDDIGAVGKYALDWMRGGNPAGSPKASTTTPAVDLATKEFHRKKAIEEIGHPDYDIEVVQSKDDNGRLTTHEIKRPLNAQERASRVDRINARENELNGIEWKPVPGFHVDSADGADNGGPSGAETLSKLALGGSAAPTGAPPAAAAEQALTPAEQSATADAVTRATQTLVDTAPGKTGTITMTDEQRQRLSKVVADAQQGKPAAVRALLKWHSGQPDQVIRDRSKATEGQAAQGIDETLRSAAASGSPGL